jgi:hypothetical protein
VILTTEILGVDFVDAENLTNTLKPAEAATLREAFSQLQTIAYIFIAKP